MPPHCWYLATKVVAPPLPGAGVGVVGATVVVFGLAEVTSVVRTGLTGVCTGARVLVGAGATEEAAREDVAGAGAGAAPPVALNTAGPGMGYEVKLL
jgi:hypothetical protein